MNQVTASKKELHIFVKDYTQGMETLWAAEIKRFNNGKYKDVIV